LAYSTEAERELEANETIRKGKPHPNIAEVFDKGAFKSSSHLFIDMELCDIDLETFIGEDLEIPETHPSVMRELEIWYIVKQIAAGLEFIHKLGPGHGHRDLKPLNGTSRSREILTTLHSSALEEKQEMETD